jgi:hypothetical protein
MDVQSPFPKPAAPSVPIRELGLSIAGSALEPVLAEFRRELEAAGIRRLRPDFYLSTEWGVPFPSVSIGIPFYLARADLTQLHAERDGYLEGVGHADLLRFLRHEMGHVVNYAYQLYEQEEWAKLFGSMTQPYVEEYRPQPFSRRHVRHLPGWYAQKHPDEDWAESFAVWVTPGTDWRAAYAGWPEALAKLEYCDRTMAALRERDPVVNRIDHDEDASELKNSIEEFYRYATRSGEDAWPPGLDAALQTIFEDYAQRDGASHAPRRPADRLIARIARDLATDVYRWTGHFPERTRPLLRHLAARAKALGQVYPEDREQQVVIAFTTLVTSLAMNHVLRGSYIP